MPRNWGTTELIPDPTAAQNPTSKNYVDTTCAAIAQGGWDDADQALYADLLSTFPRVMYEFGTPAFASFGSIAGNQQTSYYLPVTRAFTSTGIRYVTGSSSGTGNSVTISIYTGVSLASMVLQKTVTGSFGTVSTLTQVAWGSAVAVPVGFVAIVFTASAVSGTPGRIATPPNVNGQTNMASPTVTNSVGATRASATLSSPMDFTTGWTVHTLQPWISLY
jgi:hypothetical protein